MQQPGRDASQRSARRDNPSSACKRQPAEGRTTQDEYAGTKNTGKLTLLKDYLQGFLREVLRGKAVAGCDLALKIHSFKLHSGAILDVLDNLR